ncbi:hypothetical protein N9B57_05010, partial [Verrucomicrobia bacterium]|nr:hypothetical protein [Verrucomicrobiota bacterium]
QGVCLARDAVFTIGNAGTGTATGGGTDYTLTTTQVTFAAGSSNGSTQTVTVTPASDALVEGSETANFTATLTSGPATLGTQSIHAFTLDDSDNNILTVTISAASISENGGSSLATVSHTGDTSQALTVTLASNDTSEATVPSSVTIPAGSASQNFTVTGIDEAIVDGAQTVTVTGSAAGFQSGTDTIIVIDNDSPQLSLNITDASISENGGSSAATLIRNTNPGVALVVTLTSSDPSEATIPATITIPVGSNSVGFTVTATDDRYVDGQQTVTITGSAPGLSNGFDTLAVEDDDILNTPPTISPLANQTLFGTSTLGPMEFRVDDDQTAASLLTVRANSNNPTVVLDQNILLGGTGTIRTMIITGINGFGDSANINISATDSSGKTGLSSFSLTAFSESSLVVDNLDAEFSRIGTWQESAAVDEYAESSLFTSMSGSAAIFEPRQLEPGNYKILAWWAGTQSNGQSILRSPRADYEISHAGEKDTILMNQSVDGGQWVELGTFRFDGLGNENVTLSIPSGSSSLPVSADAIAFVPVAGGGSLRDIIVDNLDPGFIALGDWDESGSTDEFMSSSLATFSPEDSAIWSPSLSTAGNYDVFYWNARSTRDGRKIARAPGVKYAISHAGSLTTVILNQNSAKSGTWNPMGTYFFDASGGENVVLLATSASYETGSAGADAFRFVLRNSGSAVDVIIDNLDPEFTVEGLWSESAAIDEFGGSSVYTLSTDGAAIWSLQNEAPGIYQVFIWNSGKLSGDRRIARNTNASYTIVHSGGSSVVAIDQNQQTGQWVPLGQFEFQGDGTEKISVKSGGNSTVADAVRLVKMQ